MAGPVGGPLGPGEDTPQLGGSFPALDDNQTVIPPDTHGAVGPDHLMVTLNSEVVIQSRQGTTIERMSLDRFWEGLGHAFAFDPKVFWDHFHNRWLFVAMADAFSPDSAILIAVSHTADPTGDWTLFDVTADPAGVVWADYPNVGFNEKWVVFTANLFGVDTPFFDRSEIWVFRQETLPTTGEFVSFSDTAFNQVPAVSHDASQDAVHLVTEEDDRSLRLSTVSGPVGSEVFASGVAFAPSPDPWAFGPPDLNFLPQLGSSAKVTANDSRVLNAVFRRGSLWCTHTVFLPAGSTPTRAAVQWWEIHPTGTVIQRGRIEDPSSRTHYVFPSIGVNAFGDALLGYSRFSASQFPSANYSARFAGDAPGALGPDTVLKEGEAPYAKDFGSGRVRWGDYSATVPDPLNDTDLWTIQEYAATPDRRGDRWGTWWGQVLFGGPPDGILEVLVNPPHESTLIAGTLETLQVQVSDATAVTNATLIAAVNTGDAPNFRNNGTPPDTVAGDGTYTATWSTPATGTNVTLSLVISAPGKIPATNVIRYLVIPRPGNDHFADATKVPPQGAEFISNNRLATTEPGEPPHAAVTSAAASLWWTWSPDAATNVLFDTTGSFADTVLAVYTGNRVDALTPLAATNDVGGRRQAWLNLPVTAGAVYRIAVASVSTNNTGKIVLRVLPGGQPDLQPPVVAVTTPVSGQWLATNLVEIRGVAADPQPWASGINQVFVRVNSRTRTARDVQPGAPLSTNWFRLASLREGENLISVTASDLAGNLSQPATLTLTYRVIDPPNDLFMNAVEWTGPDGIHTANTARATREFGEPFHAGNEGGHSVWWSFLPPADGVLTLSTEGSDFDTLLGLYHGSRVHALVPVAGNDDAGPDSLHSRIEQAVRGGERCFAAVDGFGGSTGLVRLVHSFQPARLFQATVTTSGRGSVSPGSGLFGNGSTIRFRAVPDPGHFLERWEGDVTTAENPLPVTFAADLNLRAVFSPRPVTDGFESGDFSALPWIAGGPTPWRVQPEVAAEGQFAASAENVADGGTARLALAVRSRGGEGSFDYRVSSEEGWDYLEFHLDGVLQERWSGEQDWARQPLVLPEGDHLLEWRYVKDAFGAAGLDAAFIDAIDLPLAPASLRLLSSGPHGIAVVVLGAPNQIVLIQSSTDLLHWETVATRIAEAPTVSYTDPAPSGTARYFRATIR